MLDVPPLRALIEVTARCNFNCSYCPRHLIPENRLGDMEWDLFTHIVDALPKSVRWVHPQGYGEPLLYAYFFDALRYIKKSGRKIKFYTNGSLLKPGMAKEIGKIGVDRIVFSIDDYLGAVTEKSRPNVSNRVMLRVIQACEILAKYKTKTTIRMTITDSNRRRLTPIFDFWRPKVDDVVANPMFETFTPKMCNNTEWEMGKKKWRTKVCEQIMTQLMFRSDGTVSLCCNDWLIYYPIIHLDNLPEPWDFKKLFNHEKFKKVRNQLCFGRTLPGICSNLYCSKFSK